MKTLTLPIITSIILLASIDTVYSEEDSSCNMLAGYTVGLNVGYPVFAQNYYTDATGPALGINVESPYGFNIGSYAVGIGGGINMVNFGGDADYTNISLSLSSNVTDLSSGSLSISAGGGYYIGNTDANTNSSILNDYSNNTLGINGGVGFYYAIPNQPLVIQPYARGSWLLNVDGDGNQQGWLSIGTVIHYDISTLF